MKLGKLLPVSSFEAVYITYEPRDSFSYWKVKKEFFLGGKHRTGL